VSISEYCTVKRFLSSLYIIGVSDICEVVMYWACYWFRNCRNAYRLLMGKLVANIHMAGQKVEGRMMLKVGLREGICVGSQWNC
jgi:hypothetical protein